MCGICGFTGYRQDQKTVIERMMKAIEHRGPDSEGSFCREKITLGFRRLSIIDLEDGQQPMESADGNLHIVCICNCVIINSVSDNDCQSFTRCCCAAVAEASAR